MPTSLVVFLLFSHLAFADETKVQALARTIRQAPPAQSEAALEALLTIGGVEAAREKARLWDEADAIGAQGNYVSRRDPIELGEPRDPCRDSPQKL
jgi:hypothetical protein